MILSQYETLTRALIQAPSSPNALIDTTTLDNYINMARYQVATDGECVRDVPTLTLTSGHRAYAFSQMVTSDTTLIGSVVSVRFGIFGTVRMDRRPWEWFMQYFLNNGATGSPVEMAQHRFGTNGTLWFYPTPDASYTITLDTVSLPATMTSDASPEAIPGMFADAVPFYAAWLGVQSLQRQADADKMFERYKMMMARARQSATPTELPEYLAGGIGARLANAHLPLSQGGGKP